MADDASFHSCCEELLHQQHQQQHNRHHPPQCQAVAKANGGADHGCCGSCCTSDTDDDAQFLTASNSPTSLEASISSSAHGYLGGPGGAGGDPRHLVADLERTLGGESPEPESPSARGGEVKGVGLLAVASSTVTAAEPTATRPLDYSGFDVGDCEDADFPSPLASSSSASLVGLKMQQKKRQREEKQQQQQQGQMPNTGPTKAILDKPPNSETSEEKTSDEQIGVDSVCGDADNTAIAAGCLPRLSDDGQLRQAMLQQPTKQACAQPNRYLCYTDNDLTHHRPPTRRTQSGPMLIRQQDLVSLRCDLPDSAEGAQRFLAQKQQQQQQQQQQEQPPQPPPPTAQKASRRAGSAAAAGCMESIDFPARLRKRVRFADALGFDLASVVLIAGARCPMSAGFNDDDPLFELAAPMSAAGACALNGLTMSDLFSGLSLTGGDGTENSELNKGRLFATGSGDSLSQSYFSMSPSKMTLTTGPQSDDTHWASITPWDLTQSPASTGRPVTLESVRCFSDPPIIDLTVLVSNLAPQKFVTARVTFDNWRHQSDWEMRYCQTLPNGSERFRTRLRLPPLAAGFELAVSYTVGGQTYWDNNGGRNYMYVYRNSRGPTPVAHYNLN